MFLRILTCFQSSGIILFCKAHIFLYEILPQQLRVIKGLLYPTLKHHPLVCLNIAIRGMSHPSRCSYLNFFFTSENKGMWNKLPKRITSYIHWLHLQSSFVWGSYLIKPWAWNILAQIISFNNNYQLLREPQNLQAGCSHYLYKCWYYWH